MSKNKILNLIVLVFLCSSTAGCASLQKKFVRKKNLEKKQKKHHVLVAYDAKQETPQAEGLYKKRYFFWKTWHLELVNRLDMNYKKRTLCFDRALQKLIEMQEFLNEQKKEDLEILISRLKALEPAVKKNKNLLQTDLNKLKRSLEKIRRQIEANFGYLDVKDSLVIPQGKVF